MDVSDQLASWAYQLGIAVSRLLDPLVDALDQLHEAAHGLLSRLGVSYDWQDSLIETFWTVALFLLLRTLQGWWRLAAALALIVVLARVYGVLPR